MNTVSNDNQTPEYQIPTEKKVKKRKRKNNSRKTVILAGSLAVCLAFIIGFGGSLAAQLLIGPGFFSLEAPSGTLSGKDWYHSIEDIPGPGEGKDENQPPNDGYESGNPYEMPQDNEEFVPTGPFIYEKDLPEYPLPEAPRVKCVEKGNLEALGVNEISNRVTPAVVSVVAFVSEDVSEGYSLGTGTIYSSDGYIITNHHVIEQCVVVEVVFPDGEICDAEFIASDADADIAVLKIDVSGLPCVEFGRSSELSVGDTVVAIGNPVSLDFAGTTTVGRITGPERAVPVDSAGNIMKMLQTDASINPGNSGGPLVNEYGQVIGIVTAKMTADTYEGIGFAIPSDRVEKIVSDLLEYGYVKGYPMLGVTGYTVGEGEIDGRNPMGVAVVEVSPGSGAFGRIKVGDIIYSCNGETIYSIPEINAIKSRMEVGDMMTLGVYRNGIETVVDIFLKDKHG